MVVYDHIDMFKVVNFKSNGMDSHEVLEQDISMLFHEVLPNYVVDSLKVEDSFRIGDDHYENFVGETKVRKDCRIGVVNKMQKVVDFENI